MAIADSTTGHHLYKVKRRMSVVECRTCQISRRGGGLLFLSSHTRLAPSQKRRNWKESPIEVESSMDTENQFNLAQLRKRTAEAKEQWLRPSVHPPGVKGATCIHANPYSSTSHPTPIPWHATILEPEPNLEWD